MNILPLNLAPVAGLVSLGLFTWLHNHIAPKWGWVLTGIYVFGPAAMLLGSTFTRFSPSVSHPGDWFWDLVFCLFPPMTLWMATLNGMIVSILFVSAVLPLLALYQNK